MQSWMLVVQTAVMKSSNSWVKKCIGTRKSANTYGDAWSIPSMGWKARPVP